MTARFLPHSESFRHSSARADEYELLRTAIDHQLRHSLVERLDTNCIPGNIECTPQISGAIFLALQPKQFKFLIADARLSIVLALQRHLTDEQYRRRLSVEFHYRAFRPHLSESFRVLMVRPSSSDNRRFAAGRKSNLATAYQNEIERLEGDALGYAQRFDVRPLMVGRRR
jgi:hypothetical protein